MVLLIFLLVYLNTMRFKGHNFRIESLFAPLVLKAIFCSNPNSICSFSIGQIITLAASKSGLHASSRQSMIVSQVDGSILPSKYIKFTWGYLLAPRQ